MRDVQTLPRAQPYSIVFKIGARVDWAGAALCTSARVKTRLLSAATAQHKVCDSPCAVCAACRFAAADAPVRLLVSPVCADSRAVVVGCASHLHVCVQAALAPTISMTVHAAETTAAGSTAAGEQDD